MGRRGMMRHYTNPTHDDWDEHSTAVEFAINNGFQQSIGTTPFKITYGQNPLTPASLRILKVENPSALKVTESLQERLQKAKKAWKQHSNARKHMQTRTGDLLNINQVMTF